MEVQPYNFGGCHRIILKTSRGAPKNQKLLSELNKKPKNSLEINQKTEKFSQNQSKNLNILSKSTKKLKILSELTKKPKNSFKIN